MSTPMGIHDTIALEGARELKEADTRMAVAFLSPRKAVRSTTEAIPKSSL